MKALRHAVLDVSCMPFASDDIVHLVVRDAQADPDLFGSSAVEFEQCQNGLRL